jgi:hypothetical protein
MTTSAVILSIFLSFIVFSFLFYFVSKKYNERILKNAISESEQEKKPRIDLRYDPLAVDDSFHSHGTPSSGSRQRLANALARSSASAELSALEDGK